MLKRQTEGSVICPSCGVLVGVNDDTCYNCGRRNPGLWGYAGVLRRLGHDLGFVPLVMGGTITLYVLSLLLSGTSIQGMLSPDTRVLLALGASGAFPVFEMGRWWTVLTAGWLHGGVLHVLFNVMWIRQLAPAVADLYGAGRMVVLYTVAGVVGFTASSIAGLYLPNVPLIPGAVFSVGASANIFGLLGALFHYGRRTGNSHAREAGLQYALFLGIFGLIPGMGVDNWAHAGGFAGGYLASLMLDPLSRERTDHMILAFACLGLTLVALVASFVTALPYLVQ
jgi:membrane associated rhomboid family serine protease